MPEPRITPPIHRPDVATEYETKRSAAKRLDVSTRTIGRYIDAGLIRAVRVGPKLIRVVRSDVDAVSEPVSPSGAAS